MKITIIYSNGRKGNTYNCVQIFKKHLSKYGDIEYKEFFLPKDMKNFCSSCFSCFMKGEETCPHYNEVKSIVEEITDSDGVILSSPVYALDVSGSMKALLDHLCYMWISHRPREEFFSKVGMIITTTAGAGLNHTTKTLRNTFKYLGFIRIFSFGVATQSIKWEEVKPNKKVKIDRSLRKKAERFSNALLNRKKLKHKINTKLIFTFMKYLINTYDDDNYDKRYWREKKWLTGEKSPFK